MAWCEASNVRYVSAVARNPRLQRALREAMHEARLAHQHTGKPARRFRDLCYKTHKNWSCERRVIGKAEYLPGKANPSFIVTHLLPREANAKRLYEQFYCARGDMENRIKEQQLDLFADRASTQTPRRKPINCAYTSPPLPVH